MFHFAASFILRALDDYWQLWCVALYIMLRQQVSTISALSIDLTAVDMNAAMLSETNHVHTLYIRWLITQVLWRMLSLYLAPVHCL